ncbi:phosphotransferase [Actinoplanes sp. NPDC051470]|uniref:phosphotransferase n=1 Tax=unclassified Actinoplanes TaxID=2626549 RepID=UPI00343E5D1D
MDLPGGASVTMASARPVTEGWSNAIAVNPRVLRCTADDGRTVIVKMRRPPGDARRRDGFHRELTALLLLAELGCDAGPRLLATDDSAGLLVLEDLGDGPALEDLLVGSSAAAATAGFVALAEAVGRMHVATLDQAGALPAWRYLDTPGLDEVREILRSGPMVLSNGDLGPQNCRITGGRARLLDFEDAAAHHPLLDVVHFRLPFYGGACWARVPAFVSDRAESAYRRVTGRVADRAWAEGVAAAVGAWTIIRLRRLPKLIAADAPHPMGYSRRGQLLDTLRLGVTATDGVLPRLAARFARTERDLRERWPGLPASQAVYPAYASAGDHPQ